MSERSEFWSNLLRNKLVLEEFPNPKPWLQWVAQHWSLLHPSSHRHLLEVRTMLFVLLKLSLAPKNQHGACMRWNSTCMDLYGLVSIWLSILQIGKDSIKIPRLKVTSMLPRQLPHPWQGFPLLQSNIQGRPEVRLLHTCLLAGKHPTEIPQSFTTSSNLSNLFYICLHDIQAIPIILKYLVTAKPRTGNAANVFHVAFVRQYESKVRRACFLTLSSIGFIVQ